MVTIHIQYGPTVVRDTLAFLRNIGIGCYQCGPNDYCEKMQHVTFSASSADVLRLFQGHLAESFDTHPKEVSRFTFLGRPLIGVE